MERITLPNNIYCEYPSASHVQGIAFDKEKRYVYISFTTVLVKADMKGNIIGSVEGLAGHLGCIDFDDESGMVFGSLEYKRDGIGRSIAARLGREAVNEDAFYIAVFDCDKIDRIGMDGAEDGVMRAVYLTDPSYDYEALSHSGVKHRYGCSGIDGTAIGPVFGSGKDGERRLFTAYGVYGDVSREDNDHQIILSYRIEDILNNAEPLHYDRLHHSSAPLRERYYLFTGNTTYGIQNLEYDEYTGDWFAAVYRGKKDKYPNYAMYRIDGARQGEEGELKGLNGERGMLLSLKKEGLEDKGSGIFGYDFPHGSTGIHSVGDGSFYISQPLKPRENVYGTNIRLYEYCGGEQLFREV